MKTLADTFDEMVGRLDASFSAQRQFVADASHELRNPLAVIQTNADVALQEEGVSDDVRSRLVDDLLSLARAHGLSLEAHGEPGLCVVADRDAVKRALANLLDNAFRHSPAGAPFASAPNGETAGRC